MGMAVSNKTLLIKQAVGWMWLTSHKPQFADFRNLHSTLHMC